MTRLVLGWLLAVGGWLWPGWEGRMDEAGLAGRVRNLRTSLHPGDVGALERFVKGFDGDRETAPFPPEAGRLESCRSRDVPVFLRGKGLVHRRLVFPPVREGEKGAVFYLCGTEGAWRAMDRAVLWVPGMGVSRFAFGFIRPFWTAVVESGWMLVFYVPPLHLDRSGAGAKEGDGFFTADPLHDIRRITECVKELRSAGRWLRTRGTARLGGWGGSMGAAMLLLAGRHEALDHLCVMIPVLDWNTSWLGNAAFRPLVADLMAAGYGEEVLRRGYALVSPSSYPPPLSGDRMQFLLAAEDRLNPVVEAERLARDWCVGDVRTYPRAHGTILLERRMFSDYRGFLARMTGTAAR